VTKGAFVVGGEHGHGVATCRQLDGQMSGPAYFTIGGGSLGWQIGGKKTQLVLLVMNKDGLKHLLADRFTIGAEASAAVGPVGREAQAATDAQLGAQILSWSRTRGAFAGVSLDGAVVKPNARANERLYGREIEARDALTQPAREVPQVAREFLATCERVLEGRAEAAVRR
jgi:lipid-binding SYLF domain-containing protein